jgi:hypothetical protein
MRHTIHYKLKAQPKPKCEKRKTARLFKQIRTGQSNAFDHNFNTVFSFDLHMLVSACKLF